jgi:hypothetical protein
MRKKAQKSPRKVDRPIAELVGALRRHVRLLKEYASKAFRHRDEAYLGEVAGKLRLLAGDRGESSPLLLRLMKALDISVPIVLGGPPTIRPVGELGAGDTVTLRQYLGMVAYGTRTPRSAWIELTNADVIHTWAQQQGAAHEDWKVDGAFIALRDSGLYIGGQSELGAVLEGITRTVLFVAAKVLVEVTPERIESAEKRRRRT